MNHSDRNIRRLAIVTDPSELDEQDTFFLFVNEAISRDGMEVYIFNAGDVSDDSQVRTKMMLGPIHFDSRVRLDTRETIMSLHDFDVVFLKKNPMVDEEYKALLEKLSTQNIPTVNHPKGIQVIGSKAYLKHFPQITPPTHFAHDVQEALRCIRETGNCVIKQSDSYGGKGVTHIDYRDGKYHGYEQKAEVILSEEEVSALIAHYLHMSTDTTVLIVEYFLSAPERGDKRVVVLDGEILGSYIRLPDAENGLCNGADNGAEYCIPTERDHEIVRELRPYLKENGIQLAALDLLVSKDGLEHLSEINVFNPGFCNLDVVHPELQVAKKVVDMLYANMA